MASCEDFEKQIRMEMEKEIENSRDAHNNPQSSHPSVHHDVEKEKETNMLANKDVLSEEEQIKADIEERLRRKRQQREARSKAVRGKIVESIIDSHLYAQPDEEQRRQAEAEQRRQAEAEQRRQAEAEEQRRQAEAEERRQAEAEEQRRQAEAEQRRQAEAEQQRRQSVGSSSTSFVQHVDPSPLSQSKPTMLRISTDSANTFTNDSTDTTKVADGGYLLTSRNALSQRKIDCPATPTNTLRTENSNDNNSNEEGDSSSRQTSTAPPYSSSQLEILRNDNGILAVLDVNEERQLDSWLDRRASATEPRSLETFEEALALERASRGLTAEDDKRAQLRMQHYDTLREPGKCIAPPEWIESHFSSQASSSTAAPSSADEPDLSNIAAHKQNTDGVPTHVQIQLGFFSAQQTILTTNNNNQPTTCKFVTNRECDCVAAERPLSQLTCYFESHVLRDPTLTVDDEDYPHNVASERLVHREDVLRGGEFAVCKAVSSIAYGDPIQVCEHVHEHSGASDNTAEAATASATTSIGENRANKSDAVSQYHANGMTPTTMMSLSATMHSFPESNNMNGLRCHAGVAGDPRESTSTSVSVAAATRKPILPSTLGQMWVSGVDTKKPVAAVQTFTGGRILCVTAEQVSSEVVRQHGEGVDPFVVCGAFYAVMEEHSVKVSETFYFDSGLDVFYPHKDRGSLARSNRVVTFIPNEYVSSLYLLVRVLRPCMNDFEAYVDLYTRADRYKNNHVAPMKQNALLYTHNSDVMEEMGWNVKSCADFMSSAAQNKDNGSSSSSSSNNKSSKINDGMHRVPGMNARSSHSFKGLNGTDPVPLIVSVTKLYSKSMHDSELLQTIKERRLLTSIKTIPINIQFALQDVTDYEVSFPHAGPYPLPQENETQIGLLNTNTPGAQVQIYQYTPCCIPLLNAGYFMTYQNVFYIRFVWMHLNLSSTSALRTLPKSNYALAVSFCIKEHDDSLNEEDALPCIYGRYFDNAAMQTHGWSASVHNSHEFALSDEFKIQLPLNLTSRHHIFFTLYAVRVKPTVVSGENQPRTVKVGYAACPLMVEGVVQVHELLSIKFVSVEKAVKAAAGGYLSNFPKAPIWALLNNGEAVVTAVTQTRTSVNASNRVIATVFHHCSASVAAIRQGSSSVGENEDVLAHNGALTQAYMQPSAQVIEPNVHQVVIVSIANLPLAEILAFYPFLCSYAFALIASPSAKVVLANRIHMLDVLLLITTKVQQYDSSVHTMKRRYSLNGNNSSQAQRLVRTSAGSVVYHFLTNDLLYDGTQYYSSSNSTSDTETAGTDRARARPFRLYAGLAETWLAHLNYIFASRSSNKKKNSKNSSNSDDNVVEANRAIHVEVIRGGVSSSGANSNANSTTPPLVISAGNRNIEREMNDLSWFLFDAILRSFYLWNMEHPTNSSGGSHEDTDDSSSRALIDRSFYRTVADLCVLVLRMLSTYDESTLVRRVALFTRNLMRYGDRGSVLYIYDCIVRYFEHEGNYESMTNYLRYVLEDTEVVYLLLPGEQAQEPVFFTEILVRAFTALIVHPNRETRVIAAAVMYNFLRRLTDDPTVPSRVLRGLASQLFVLVIRTAPQCRALMPTSAGQDRKPDWIALHDRRELTMVVLWILYYTPRPRIRAWMQTESNVSALVGVMQLLSDGQVPFRYRGAQTGTTGMAKSVQPTQAGKDSGSNSTSSSTLQSYRPESIAESRALAKDRSNGSVTAVGSDTNTSAALSSAGVRDWESRLATLVTAMGVEMCSLFLHNLPRAMLRSVKEDRPNACVLPYFILLESVLHLGNSTASLQMAATALHETVRELLPEIASRSARMSGGVMLLTLRLMSSCCQHVRVLAGWTYLLMSQAYFTWTRSLNRVMSLTTNALVSVAESRLRDLRLAGRFVELQFDDVIHSARVEEVNYIAPAPDFDARYRHEADAAGAGEKADVQSALPVERQHHVGRLFMSIQRVIPLSDAVMARHSQRLMTTQRQVSSVTSSRAHRGTTNASVHDEHAKQMAAAPRAILANNNQQQQQQHSMTSDVTAQSLSHNFSSPLSSPSKAFSHELREMTATVLTLFNHVLRLQADNSMQFHEARVFAYFDIFHSFLKQHALKEALQWLHRIYDLHRSQHNTVEAGMVLVLMAAVGFRATELYYFIHGGQSRGAYLPYAIFGRVFWHDYVRILPEAERLLPADALYAIVSEMYVCPDDPCFTVEGQIRTLKEACELFDKVQYYEFAVSTVRVVLTYLDAIADYRAAAVVHTALSSWYSAMAQHTRQPNSRYFLLWARMEREEPMMPLLSSRITPPQLLLAGSDEAAAGLSSLLRGRVIHRVYKMPANFTLDSFRAYARDYVQSLFDDPSRVVLTEELTTTLPALPEPDSKRKRIAAAHRAVNHCLVSVSEVQPFFGKGSSSSSSSAPSSSTNTITVNGSKDNNNTSPTSQSTALPMGVGLGIPDVAMIGFDKTMHIANFEHVRHGEAESNWARSPVQPRALLQHSMTISTYELERPFPATTTAIAVARTHQITLDAYDTAKEIIQSREEGVANAAENASLIVELRRALSVNELPPGAYMKEVITLMSDHDDVIATLRSFAALVRAKLEVCDRLNAVEAYPEEYALVLKAVTDMECCLISVEEAVPLTSTTV